MRKVVGIAAALDDPGNFLSPEAAKAASQETVNHSHHL